MSRKRAPLNKGDIVRVRARSADGRRIGLCVVAEDQGGHFDMVSLWRLEVTPDSQLTRSMALDDEVSVVLRKDEIRFVLNSEQHMKSCETEW